MGRENREGLRRTYTPVASGVTRPEKLSPPRLKLGGGGGLSVHARLTTVVQPSFGPAREGGRWLARLLGRRVPFGRVSAIWMREE
jgi:hypothetical protein